MLEQICLSDSLVAAAKEVFEKMVFMQVAEYDGPPPHLDGDVLLGSITFRNGIEGCLNICCDRECGRTIALNMLGMSQDDQLSEEEIKDAIGEVTNMVMGSVKAAVHQDFDTLQVSIPVVVTGRNLENSLGERTFKTSVYITTEDNRIMELVLLYRESRQPKT